MTTYPGPLSHKYVAPVVDDDLMHQMGRLKSAGNVTDAATALPTTRHSVSVLVNMPNPEASSLDIGGDEDSAVDSVVFVIIRRFICPGFCRRRYTVL